MAPATSKEVMLMGTCLMDDLCHPGFDCLIDVCQCIRCPAKPSVIWIHILMDAVWTSVLGCGWGGGGGG